MITIDKILSVEKTKLEEVSLTLDKNDIAFLVDLLNEKNDKIRYQALQLLQNRSSCSNDVYPFWDIFLSKLKSDNSYQRSIGVMMISENSRWDKEEKLNTSIDDYLNILKDEKPITVRQCIQALSDIVKYKPHLCKKLQIG
jgi:uncharacterized protein with gpF-like domain